MKHYVFAHTIDTETSERIEHLQEFNSYRDALDYYIDTLKNQSEQLVDHGGDHTIFMYTKDDESIRVLKRHTISTTFNKTKHND